MTKKKKALIITLAILIILTIALSIFFWGMQPGLEFDISYKNLLNKIGKKFILPHEFPYEITECKIKAPISKARRFSIISNFAGFSIICSDGDNSISIWHDEMGIALHNAEYIDILYNNKAIKYCNYIYEDKFNVHIIVSDKTINKQYYELGYSTGLNYDIDKIKTDIKIIIDSTH